LHSTKEDFRGKADNSVVRGSWENPNLFWASGEEGKQIVRETELHEKPIHEPQLKKTKKTNTHSIDYSSLG